MGDYLDYHWRADLFSHLAKFDVGIRECRRCTPVAVMSYVASFVTALLGRFYVTESCLTSFFSTSLSYSLLFFHIGLGINSSMAQDTDISEPRASSTSRPILILVAR